MDTKSCNETKPSKDLISRTGRRWVLLRRISQGIFLTLFLILILQIEMTTDFSKQGVKEITISHHIEAFMGLDPLIALSTIITSRTLYHMLILSLIIVVLTVFFGRFFCGWICPFGTLHHITAVLFPSKKQKELCATNRPRKYYQLKYIFLLIFLVLTVFGVLQIGILDPLSLLTRSLCTAIIPALNILVRLVFNLLYSTNIGIFQHIAAGGFLVSEKVFLSYNQEIFQQALVIGMVFLLLLFLNRYVTRFFCRTICPLGAFLGILSRFSIFRLQKQADKCNQCNQCLRYCQGADEPIPGEKWVSHECIKCFNCLNQCATQALAFSFEAPNRKLEVLGPDLNRRNVLSSVIIGTTAFSLARVAPAMFPLSRSLLIRPPGSLEERHFLGKCLKCGLCMKACPANALQPAWLEGGLEGLWTPVLKPKIGYCEEICTICSQVCPTGAIQKITRFDRKGVLTDKNGNRQKDEKGHYVSDSGRAIKIGTAFIDKGRCLPWAMATPCIVCEEYCPNKAIWVKETAVIRRKEKISLQQPFVDPKMCVGCGACEYVCPVKDQSAIRVTSVGETRSKSNRILLK